MSRASELRKAKQLARYGRVTERRPSPHKRGEVWQRPVYRKGGDILAQYVIVRSSIVNGRIRIMDARDGYVFDTSAEGFFCNVKRPASRLHSVDGLAIIERFKGEEEE